jgi:hypothetical protein
MAQDGCTKACSCPPGSSGRVVQLRVANRGKSAPTSREQNLPVAHKSCRVTAIGRGVESTGVIPRPSGWVVQLRTVSRPASRGQDISVGQQCGRMETPRYIETAGNAPCLRGRVVQLRAADPVWLNNETDCDVCSPHDQNLPVLQPCRCVNGTFGVEAARKCPARRGRIIEFCSVRIRSRSRTMKETARNQDLAVLEQRRCVAPARFIEATRDAPGSCGRVI